MLDSTTKQCSRCKQVKPFSAFRRDSKKPNGCHSMCRICASENERKLRRDNPEKSRNIARKRVEERRRRGLCIRCGKEREFSNFVLCKRCRDYALSIQKSPYAQYRKECAICGFEYSDVHHLDGNHNNNEPSNLISLCPNHHRMVHWGLLSIVRVCEV